MKLLAACGCVLALAVPSALPAAPAPKPMLGSTVYHWDKLPVRPTPHGERRDVANQPSPTLAVFESHITTLAPGKASHPPHRHPQEEMIFVKEGTLDVHINGTVQRAGPGSVLLYLSNDAHAVTNVGTGAATYWVVNLASAATHAPELHNPKPTLRSAVYDWEKLAVQPTKTGERRAIFKGSTVTLKDLSVHATTINVGEAAHGAHRHPDDELVIVREGTLEVTIGDRTERAAAGSLLFFASNDLHGMRNAGDTRASYYVIRMVTAATPPAPAK